MIILYACTAPIGGFVSARLYRQIGGKAWLSNALVTATVFPIPLVLVFTWVNSLALAHGSSAALPVVAVFIITACSMALLHSRLPWVVLYLGGSCRRISMLRVAPPVFPVRFPQMHRGSVPQRRKCASCVP